MNFTITVPVKPYVKRFLENNYGSPVNFRNHPREKDFFIRMLHRPAKEYETRYNLVMTKFSTSVSVEISENCFYRHGWEISRTDTVAFGKYFERNAKMIMRTMVGTYISFGMPISEAILTFQEHFNLQEEYWTFDSIKRDFFRYKILNEIDFKEYAFQHLEKLVILNMSGAGILSKSSVNKINIKAIK